MSTMDASLERMFDQGIISGVTAYEAANEKRGFEQYKDSD
jgi:hypothetical protein